MTWDPSAEWAKPIQADQSKRIIADGETQEPISLKPRDETAQVRRRARTDRGTFQGDNPKTPEQNEAYETQREN
jgi:hypothetical protein